MQQQQQEQESPFERWESHWKSGNTPWDAGDSSPALLKLLAEPDNGLPNGTAIVPGCGSGYDILALSSNDRHVIGFDISPSAVVHAQKLLEKHNSANAEIRLKNFFEIEMEGDVDLMYDYTFLCALPPNWREKWAEKTSKLIKSGGILLTLMYPLDGREGGPPFNLSVEIYKNLLIPKGFELIRLDENVPSHESRIEKLGIWKKA